MLSVVGKIYSGILIDRVCRATGSWINDVQESFRAGRGRVDQIFILKQIVKKEREKKAECIWVL